MMLRYSLRLKFGDVEWRVARPGEWRRIAREIDVPLVADDEELEVGLRRDNGDVVMVRVVKKPRT